MWLLSLVRLSNWGYKQEDCLTCMSSSFCSKLLSVYHFVSFRIFLAQIFSDPHFPFHSTVMTLDEPLSRQRPADSKQRESLPFKTTMLLTSPPSEEEARRLSSPEDHQPNPINASSTSSSDNKIEEQDALATENLIVFIDPMETRWILPFETAKTLEVLLTL